MSKVFDDVLAGLNEAVAYGRGEESGAIVHEITPIDIKAIRAKIGMSQSEFARAVGVKLPTLRHWERGDRRPSGSARVLLNLIARDPEAIIGMMRGGSVIAVSPLSSAGQ